MRPSVSETHPRPGPSGATPRRPLWKRIRLPKGSLVLTGLTVLSVALGYAREGILAYYFGTGAVLDAFYVAFTLPQLLVALATTVSVSALLPVYVGHLKGGHPDLAQKLVQRWFSLLLAVMTTVAVLLGIAPEAFMSALAPGFDPALTRDASQFLRGLLPYTVLGGVAATYKVVLDSHQRFTAPAAARAAVAVLVIASTVIGAARFGVWALVAGYSAGGALMFGIHVLGARGVTERPRLLRLGPPRLDGLPLSNVGWITLQMALGQLFTIADRFFASGLEAGSIAALNYSRAIVTAPQNLVTSVLATVLFPILAAKVAEGRTDAALRETAKWLGVIVVASAPIVGLVIAFRVEIVDLLFQRGAFDVESTALVASVLTVLPFTIMLGGCNAVLNRLLLSRKAFKVTAALAAITGLAKIVMNASFVEPLGITGLALASVLSGLLGLVLRLVYGWRRDAAPAVPPPPSDS